MNEDLIEKAVRITIEVAKPQANPYNYLYHNPTRIFTLQWFSHWTQRYQNYMLYKLMLEICRITSHLAIPQVIFNRHTDKYSDKKVRIAKNVFYIVNEQEITPNLKLKYESYRNFLNKELEKPTIDLYT